MKVLMTADAVGGVWTYALTLGEALRSRGVEVVLAVLGPEPSDEQRAAWRGKLLSHPGRLEWMEDPWDDVDAAGAWLLQLADELRPDVVHLNGYAHGALPFAARRVVVAHSDVLSWWEAVRGSAAPSTGYREAVSAGLAGADEVVAISDAVLTDVRRHYGVTGGRVIHNGVAARDPAAVGKQPFVLGAGRLWDEAKGLDLLAAAAPSLSWAVKVAGDGGQARGVELLGRLAHEELLALMDRASVFAHPARYEPFGLAALEAAQSGCALVLGDLPSLREVWGDAAVFVPPGDAAALASALQRLIDDGDERELLASAARERARLYTVDRMAAAYLEVYDRQAVPA